MGTRQAWIRCRHTRGVLNVRGRKPVEVAAGNSVGGGRRRRAAGGCSGALGTLGTLVVDGGQHDAVMCQQRRSDADFK